MKMLADVDIHSVWDEAFHSECEKKIENHFLF